MSDHQRSSVREHGALEHFARVHLGTSQVPDRHCVNVGHAVPRVEVDRDEVLAIGAADRRLQQPRDVCRIADTVQGFGLADEADIDQTDSWFFPRRRVLRGLLLSAENKGEPSSH